MFHVEHKEEARRQGGHARGEFRLKSPGFGDEGPAYSHALPAEDGVPYNLLIIMS